MKLDNRMFRYLVAAGTLVVVGGAQAFENGGNGSAPSSAPQEAVRPADNTQPTLDQMLGRQSLDCQPWAPEASSASLVGSGAGQAEVDPSRNG